LGHTNSLQVLAFQKPWEDT